MGKFDLNNVQSVEVAALKGLATLISDCTAFASLCEETVGANARTKVFMGPMAPAWDAGEYSRAQLEQEFCHALIHPPEESEKVALLDSGSFLAPRESGSFAMRIRRLARESELGVENGHNDLYMWFLDTICALETELMQKMETRDCPRLLGIQRVAGPAYSSLAQQVAQSEYLWCLHLVTWGLSEE